MDLGDGWERVLRGLVIALVCDLWCLNDVGLGTTWALVITGGDDDERWVKVTGY